MMPLNEPSLPLKRIAIIEKAIIVATVADMAVKENDDHHHHCCHHHQMKYIGFLLVYSPIAILRPLPNLEDPVLVT